MRKVLYKKWIPREWVYSDDKKTKTPKEGTGIFTDFVNEGVFHQWGVSYEEFDAGPANFSIAIIETPTGEIEEVLPSYIKFI